MKYQHHIARKIAEEFAEEMKPFVERVEVVGSLRRMRPLVRDFELLFVPKIETRPNPSALFGDEESIDLAAEHLDACLRLGVLTKREGENGVTAWGEKNKLAIHVPSGIPCDFFSVPQEKCTCCAGAGTICTGSYATDSNNPSPEPNSVREKLRPVRHILQREESASLQQEMQHLTTVERGENEVEREEPSDGNLQGLSESVHRKDILQKEDMFASVRKGASDKSDAKKRNVESKGGDVSSTGSQAGICDGLLPGHARSREEAPIRDAAQAGDGASRGKEIRELGNGSPQERGEERQPTRESRNSDAENAHGEGSLPSLLGTVSNQVICPDCSGKGWIAPNWFMSLVIRTGGKDSNLEITTAAMKQGEHAMAYGPGFKLQNGTIVKMNSERQVFEHVRLPYREPQDRP